MKGKTISLLLILTLSQYAYSQCESISVQTVSNFTPLPIDSLFESDGLRDGPDYLGATLYYPLNGKSNLKSIVLVPGFTATQESVSKWARYFPLLFNLHGGGGANSAWQATSDMRPIADTADFILVYPQARPDPSDGNSFNWIPKVPGAFDDVPFFSSLIDTIASNYQIDQNKIYACGYSLGGDMTFELGCKLNNRIAAIAPVARTMQADPNSFCSPGHPTGVLTILGTDDLVSPYNGIVFGGVEYYISAAATQRYWAIHNNCDTTAAVNIVSPSVERYTWSTASGCAYVEELKVIGGGHDWPGSFGNMTIDANIEIWQFVSRYDINGLIGCITTSINENNGQNDNKQLIKIVDLLGRESKDFKSQPLFYIYDDGTVEKRIILE